MGGAEYSLFEFLNNLRQPSIEIHAILPFQMVELLKEKVKIPICFHDFRLPFLKKDRNIKSFFRTLTSIIIYNYRIFKLAKKQDIKIIYCNTYRNIPYCFAIKLFSKKQVICHCRDSLQSRFVRYIVKLGSDKIIVVSAALKSQISHSNNVQVIYNGVSASYYSGEKRSGWFHHKKNIPRNVKLIGNIGQIVAWKNQMDYILVAKELLKKRTDLHFLLIGNIVDDNYFHLLEDEIISSNLQTYFTLTRYVDDIEKYICELDVLLHTAINEPFGRVIIEVAAAAVAVVAYNSGGPSEIIRNNETGFLVQNRDIHKMAETTFMLLDNSLLRQSIGESAQRYVTKNFNSVDYSSKLYYALL